MVRHNLGCCSSSNKANGGRIIHVRMGYFYFHYSAFIQSTSEIFSEKGFGAGEEVVSHNFHCSQTIFIVQIMTLKM